MKNIKIIRDDTSDYGTFGTLIYEDIKLCTGELPWRNNNIRVSCIPSGVYTAKLYSSSKFGKVYKLDGTEPRTYILIHSGNYCGDVKKQHLSDVEGCILLGERFGRLNNQKVVLSSRRALGTFMQAMENEDLEITIENETNENF